MTSNRRQLFTRLFTTLVVTGLVAGCAGPTSGADDDANRIDAVETGVDAGEDTAPDEPSRDEPADRELDVAPTDIEDARDSDGVSLATHIRVVVAGACTNPPDANRLWPAGSESEATDACQDVCAAGEETELRECVEACLLDELELSSRCVECHTELIECSLLRCGDECRGAPNASDCDACVARECEVEFRVCAGWVELVENGPNNPDAGPRDSGSTDVGRDVSHSALCDADETAALRPSSDIARLRSCAWFCARGGDVASCMADCFFVEEVISVECALCFGVYAECAQARCAPQCGGDPYGPSCYGCAGAECASPLADCIGRDDFDFGVPNVVPEPFSLRVIAIARGRPSVAIVHAENGSPFRLSVEYGLATGFEAAVSGTYTFGLTRGQLGPAAPLEFVAEAMTFQPGERATLAVYDGLDAEGVGGVQLTKWRERDFDGEGLRWRLFNGAADAPLVSVFLNDEPLWVDAANGEFTDVAHVPLQTHRLGFDLTGDGVADSHVEIPVFEDGSDVTLWLYNPDLFRVRLLLTVSDGSYAFFDQLDEDP